jgi:hypothetical protein
VAIIGVFMLYRGGRKRLKRMWKLSKEGPIFKLGVWCWTKMLSGVLVLDRGVLYHLCISQTLEENIYISSIEILHEDRNLCELHSTIYNIESRTRS